MTFIRVRPLRVGDRVKKVMGVVEHGTVVREMHDYSDGSYRRPYGHENAIFVKWDDGTKGWVNNVHVVREY